MNLIDELQAKGGDALVDAVAHAIGPVTRNKADTFRTVRAYYIDYSNTDILAVYLVSAGRMIRFEQSTDGTANLTACVPMSRVARISQQATPTKTSVVIELDADRTSLMGIAQRRPVEGADGDAAIHMLEANLLPSAWVIEVADPAQTKRLTSFAAHARAALALLAAPPT